LYFGGETSKTNPELGIGSSCYRILATQDAEIRRIET
jgi:hypothetical protein